MKYKGLLDYYFDVSNNKDDINTFLEYKDDIKSILIDKTDFLHDYVEYINIYDNINIFPKMSSIIESINNSDNDYKLFVRLYVLFRF